MGNNPISNVDPNGLWSIIIWKYDVSAMSHFGGGSVASGLVISYDESNDVYSYGHVTTSGGRLGVATPISLSGGVSFSILPTAYHVDDLNGWAGAAGGSVPKLSAEFNMGFAGSPNPENFRLEPNGIFGITFDIPGLGEGYGTQPYAELNYSWANTINEGKWEELRGSIEKRFSQSPDLIKNLFDMMNNNYHYNDKEPIIEAGPIETRY